MVSRYQSTLYSAKLKQIVELYIMLSMNIRYSFKISVCWPYTHVDTLNYGFGVYLPICLPVYSFVRLDVSTICLPVYSFVRLEVFTICPLSTRSSVWCVHYLSTCLLVRPSGGFTICLPVYSFVRLVGSLSVYLYTRSSVWMCSLSVYLSTRSSVWMCSLSVERFHSLIKASGIK